MSTLTPASGARRKRGGWTRLADPTLASLRRLGGPASEGSSPLTHATGESAIAAAAPGSQPATMAAASGRAGADDTAAPPQPPPRRIGGYEVLDELGRGGMGVVYRAYQARLGRIVALKMMLSGRYADPKFRDRFRREAEAIAGLRHPHIVQIFDVGEEPDEHGHPMPFMVLEYVAGGTLDDRTHGEPQRPDVAARRVESLASAVHRRTAAGSSTATSSPATSWSTTTAGSRSPISAWPSGWRRPTRRRTPAW